MIHRSDQESSFAYSEALKSVEYLFIAITMKPILRQSGSTC